MQILQRKIIKILVVGATSILAVLALLLMHSILCLCGLMAPETVLHDTSDAASLRFDDRKLH